ncbi:MAG: signal peptidase I [Alphaproteobacteria bacterium]|nr:signal peptidase I [Alphaproteobacteria bacterium]MBN2674914.1 signal peptidase I [Alphaproteobacteria bacterium]
MPAKTKNATREWFNTIFYGALIAIIFRSLLLEPFNIPSGSMIPTLQVGDHIFITKWSYGYSRNSFPFGSWKLWNGRVMEKKPTVGDVIVFRNPINESLDYVKRLIGEPGDTIQMISGRLYINGKQVERENKRPYIIANLPKSLRSVGYYKDNISIKGNKIWVDNIPADFNYTIEYKSNDFCDTYPSECDVFNANEYTETLPNGVKHSIIEVSDNARFDNTPVFKVPENHYFFMGDNRDNSGDSRADIGYIPADNILGKVWFVWYSHNYYAPMAAIWTWGNKMRWGRFGMGIK